MGAAINLERGRAHMVEHHLARRGIHDERVLDAFRTVPREEFLPESLIEDAYRDTPLPIGEEQTISQPYIVAFTAEALRLRGGERVLEVGTGSGYAAAILSRVAKHVVTIERIASLGEMAKQRLARLGYDNIDVVIGDGTLGVPEHAPYDAIAVAAGGPKPPPALLTQLAIGGRLVIPVGPDESSQQLVRFTRVSETEFSREALADVRFVPLIGEHGFAEEEKVPVLAAPRAKSSSELRGIASLVHECAEPIDDIERASIDRLLDRIGDARVVLLGEATHGTSEFYRMRTRITKELIARRGFQFVAVEADWPDAARIDDYVLGDVRRSKVEFTPFSRFPTWMWRNEEITELIGWLRAFNAEERTSSPSRQVGFHGLDLYSLFTSIAAVLAYLDEVDPDAARIARHRYGSLTPWQKDPAAYGEAVLVGRYESSEKAVVTMLREMLEKRFEYAKRDGARFFDAAQNARVVAHAERYYRIMYYGGAGSWNLRDAHMFDTLRTLLAFYGEGSKGIVWEHNSHVGDAASTEMSTRGEHNVGEMCREAFGDQAYIVGFGTDHGTVAAAHNWGAPMERMRVRPAAEGSYEHLFHRVSMKSPESLSAFSLHLRDPVRRALREELIPSQLERAIGVVYRPDSEMLSHYFYASLPLQFDEYIWFDETRAVSPLALPTRTMQAMNEVPETYPFGL